MAINTYNTDRIGISVNLPTGATYDVLLVQTPSGFPKSQILFQFGDTPRKITGIQKVAQTFIKILFTTRGSDVLRPGLGTRFSELTIGANKTSSDAVFRSNIADAVKAAEAQTKYALNDSTSDASSKLDRVEIQGFQSTQDSLALYLRLVTMAGKFALVAVPFPELDLNLNG